MKGEKKLQREIFKHLKGFPGFAVILNTCMFLFVEAALDLYFLGFLFNMIIFALIIPGILTLVVVMITNNADIMGKAFGWINIVMAALVLGLSLSFFSDGSKDRVEYETETRVEDEYRDNEDDD